MKSDSFKQSAQQLAEDFDLHFSFCISLIEAPEQKRTKTNKINEFMDVCLSIVLFNYDH